MITEGLIISINYSSNSCRVRLPIYETVQGFGDVIVEARFAIQPGMYNSYIEGDMVWVAFAQNKPNLPIIIGKIYKGATEENTTKGGSFNCTNFKCSGSVALPKTVNLQSQYFATLEEALKMLKAINEQLNGNTTATSLLARYSTRLSTTHNGIDYTVFFETTQKYENTSADIQVFLHKVALSCNTQNKLLPVYGNQKGIYITETAIDTATYVYKIYLADGTEIFDSSGGDSISIMYTEITRI